MSERRRPASLSPCQIPRGCPCHGAVPKGHGHPRQCGDHAPGRHRHLPSRREAAAEPASPLSRHTPASPRAPAAPAPRVGAAHAEQLPHAPAPCMAAHGRPRGPAVRTHGCTRHAGTAAAALSAPGRPRSRSRTRRAPPAHAPALLPRTSRTQPSPPPAPLRAHGSPNPPARTMGMAPLSPSPLGS